MIPLAGLAPTFLKRGPTPLQKAVSARGCSMPLFKEGHKPATSRIIFRLPLTTSPPYLRLCIEVKDLTPTGLRPRPFGLWVFTRGRPTGSLQITAFVRVKIIVDYDK